MTELYYSSFRERKDNQIHHFPTRPGAKDRRGQVKDFAMMWDFWHSLQSVILDVDDANWKDKASRFSLEKLQENREYCRPILCEIPQDIAERLKEISTLKSAREAYNYGRSIEHDRVPGPLLSCYFVKDNSGEIEDVLESDRMYNLWGFINKIFKGIGIHAIGKEKASIANSKARNKRKLSAIDPSGNKKMGHRIDVIYCGSNIELGGHEIGKDNVDTREMKDGMLKLPIVLKDMLSSVINTMPSLAHRVHALGYNINGNSITMLDVDIPDGFMTRVWRIRELTLPTYNRDYVPRMVPLLELALRGKLLLEETLEEIQGATVSVFSVSHFAHNLS
ncbi:hypothetical protein BJV82DRAFT_575023 [Fennellomyces sp. T-0311]|nr:hypothetical protein BJV82DRAFT_575023 [Fennellomyces sp. T-0311]